MKWECDCEECFQSRNSLMAKSKTKTIVTMLTSTNIQVLTIKLLPLGIRGFIDSSLYAQQAYFRQPGLQERILNLINACSSADHVMATGAERAGVVNVGRKTCCGAKPCKCRNRYVSRSFCRLSIGVV